MTPSWVLDSFQIWQRGDDVDIKEVCPVILSDYYACDLIAMRTQSITRHRLSVFSDVVLTPSGIEDVSRRTEVNRLLTQQGGTYVKQLERPVRVTHLLCAGDVETDKMRYARKFNSRGEANIRLVWEEWFWDSLEFGGMFTLNWTSSLLESCVIFQLGRFDEEEYRVDLPRPGRRQPPFIASANPSQPAELEVVPEVAVGQLNAQDDEEVATARRVPAITLQVWESLLRPRGYVRVGGKLVLQNTESTDVGVVEIIPAPVHSVGLATNRTSTQRDKGKESEVEQNGISRSALATFKRTHSFAPARLDAGPSTRQLFRRATSTRALTPAPAPSQPVQITNTTGLFSGIRFHARGEARCSSVREAVEGGGG